MSKGNRCSGFGFCLICSLFPLPPVSFHLFPTSNLPAPYRLCNKNKSSSSTKRVMFLAKNLKNTAKCEHRIWPFKCKRAKAPLYEQKRARVKGEKTFYSCSYFASVDMWALPTRYAFTAFKLDILPLCDNSISDKFLVCEANISSRRYMELRKQPIENPQGIYLNADLSVKDVTLTVWELGCAVTAYLLLRNRSASIRSVRYWFML